METKDKLPDAYTIVGYVDQLMEHTSRITMGLDYGGHPYDNNTIRAIAKEHLFERLFKLEFGVDYDDGIKLRRRGMEGLKKSHRVVPVYFTYGEILTDGN